MLSDSPVKKTINIMGVCLILGALLILLSSSSPLGGLKQFFLMPFKGALNFGNTLNKMTLYLLSAIAVLISFKSGEFNLGGEGQICLGGFVSLVILLPMEKMPRMAGILLALGGSLAAGAIVGWIIGILKVKFSISEVLSSYIISLGLIDFFAYAVNGPLKDPNSYLMTTPGIREKYRLDLWLSPSSLNSSLALALFLVLALYIFLYHHRIGLEWRLCGINRLYASYNGINTKKVSLRVLSLSGALYGLTGSIAIIGTYHRGLIDFHNALGWNGMAVSLMSGHHPILLIPGAFFFSLITIGAERLNLMGRLSIPINEIIVALTFLFVTAGRRKSV